ncbi:MAG TPA: glutamyl-tRNA reductase, partial [Acidobacteriota bacterium]|nr:glutamyl-tRNA reductase [Acidobacteriota bacterium]
NHSDFRICFEENKVLIVCLSVSYKKASVPMLESLNFKNKEEATKRCCSLESVREAVLLQTCNRIEIYVNTSDNPDVDVVMSLVRFWSQQVGVSSDLINKTIEVYHDSEALLHLFRLSSGLESMVVGEDQILGQVRTAYVDSKKIGTVETLLEKVFMKAVNVGRRVRTETQINEGSISVSSVAVDLAEKRFGTLKDVNAMVVGAGETGSLVAKELAQRGARRICIANRTFKKALELADLVMGKAIHFEDMYYELRGMDLAVFAVSVGAPLLRSVEMKNILEGRKNPNLMLIDISQPRSIEENIGSLPSVELRNIDDLKSVLEENLKKRLIEAEKAEQIISEELKSLDALLGRLLAEPLVSSLCIRVEDIRGKELQKALRMVRDINKEQKLVIENLTKELVERILQLPIENMRRAALKRDSTTLSAARKLFELDEVD